MSLYGEFPNLYMGDTAMANIMVDGKPVRKLSFWELLKKVGPGIILTGVVIGPGNITISAMLGANYGYSMIWLILPIIFMGIAFMMTAYRIGMLTGMRLFMQYVIIMEIGLLLLPVSLLFWPVFSLH